MRIERTRQPHYVVELHAYELAHLMTAARWTLENGGGQLPPDAVKGLQRIVESYDEQLEKLGAESNSPA